MLRAFSVAPSGTRTVSASDVGRATGRARAVANRARRARRKGRRAEGPIIVDMWSGRGWWYLWKEGDY